MSEPIRPARALGSLLPTDPAAYAVSLIVEAMPGFVAQIDAQRDRIEFRGPFYLGGWATGEAMANYVYPVPSEPGFDTDPGPSPSFVGSIAYNPRKVEHFAANLIEATQRAGIDRLGLKPLIDADLEKARREAYADGHKAGRDKGRAEGRAEATAEFAEIIRTAIGGTD